MNIEDLSAEPEFESSLILVRSLNGDKIALRVIQKKVRKPGFKLQASAV